MCGPTTGRSRVVPLVGVEVSFVPDQWRATAEG